jgi:hypothetical protein
MVILSKIRVNTIVYSYNNNFDDMLLNFTSKKVIDMFEYITYNEYLLFESLEIKKYFDEFFRFLKRLINIESVYLEEIIIINGFHELNTLQQNILKSFFSKRVFILLTNKYSMINRNILSYFVTLKINSEIYKKNNLKDILFSKFIEHIKVKDIGKKKEVCYQLQQSSIDIRELFKHICCYVLENPVVTYSSKSKIVKLLEEYERYYRISCKDLIVLEGLLIKLSYELKDFVHCL